MPPRNNKDHITLDRRINIVSLANLVTLLGVLLTAIGSWYGMTSKVDVLSYQVSNTTTELTRIRSDFQDSIKGRDSELRGLRDKTDNISTRMTVVETQLTGVVDSLKRVEVKLENPKKP